MDETTVTRRARRTGRVMLKALVAGAVVAVGALAIYAVAGPTGSSQSVTPADVARAAVITFDITTTATGDLQAKNQIELKSELDSDTTIVELIPEGTVVRKGDLIIRLNGDQLKSQIDDEQLRVESAKSDLIAAEKAYEIQISENESKLRQAQLKLDLAQLALEQWEKGEVQQKRQDIKLAKDKAQRDLDRLQKKVEQNQSLLNEGFLSQDAFDQDLIRLIEAQAAKAKADLDDATYSEYQYPKDRKSKMSDVEEAAAELERVKQQNNIQLTIKDAARLNQRRQLAIREDRLSNLQRQYAACSMTAPSAGLVVYASSAGRGWGGDDQPFQVGRRVMPRETLIVLPDTSEMVAVVKVHESLAGRIRPGQDATVKIDMLGETFRGRVDSIGIMAETTDRWRDPNRREYNVRILLDKAGQQDLRPSMRCEAVITLGRVENALAVPLQAVFSDEGLRFVYVERRGKFARVPVKVGRRSDTFAQITAGLDEGARVLLRQPAQGEIIDEPWDPAKLALVGFELGENGKPVPVAGTDAGGPGIPTGDAPPGPKPDRAQGPGARGPGQGRPDGRNLPGDRGGRPGQAQRPRTGDAGQAPTTSGGTENSTTESGDGTSGGPKPGGG